MCRGWPSELVSFIPIKLVVIKAVIIRIVIPSAARDLHLPGSAKMQILLAESARNDNAREETASQMRNPPAPQWQGILGALGGSFQRPPRSKM